MTLPGRFGLMRPVARIAQSVEQGIENPRVPGSIPGSGTIFKEPASGGFLHSGANPLSKVRFTRHIPVARPSGRAGTRCKNAPGIFVRVRAPSLKNPPLAGFCVYGANPSSKVRFTRHILWLALWVALARDAKMRPAFSGSGTIFKEPASGGFLRLWGEPVIEGSTDSRHSRTFRISPLPHPFHFSTL